METQLVAEKPNLKQAIKASTDASLKGVCEVIATKSTANGLELKVITKSSGKEWFTTLQQISKQIAKGDVELIDDNTFRFKTTQIGGW